MKSTSLIIPLLLFLLASGATGQNIGLEDLGKVYQESVGSLDRGTDGTGAARILEQLEAVAGKPTDVIVAGMVRGLCDELARLKRDRTAEELLVQANRVPNLSAAARTVLQGWNSRAALERGLTWPQPAVSPRRGVTMGFNPAIHLDRVRTGNQVGLLKVYDDEGVELFNRGLDFIMFLPLSDYQRERIFSALGIDPYGLDAVIDTLMMEYPTSRKQREILALLGVIASSPEVSDYSRRSLLRFLSDVALDAQTTGFNHLVARRQALLALALSHEVDDRTVWNVVKYYESVDNRWLEFPVGPFFEYHSRFVRQLADIEAIRERLASVPSFYTAGILYHL